MATRMEDILAIYQRSGQNMIRPKSNISDIYSDALAKEMPKVLANNPAALIQGKAKATQANKLPWWQSALEFIDRGRAANVGGALEVLEGKGRLPGWMAAVAPAPYLGLNALTTSGFWKGLSGQEHRSASEALDLAGWQNKEGWNWTSPGDMAHDILGFAGDVAGDPLTYLTFGAGSAIKAGATASLRAAVKEGAKAGIKVTGKNAAKVPDLIFDATQKRMIKQGADRISAQAAAYRTAEAARTTIENAGKSARNVGQNRLLNFDVPFTGSTVGIGKKPALLQKVERKIGETGAATVANLFEKAGINATKQAEILAKMGINVAKLSDLNIQQFDHIASELSKYTRAVNENDAFNAYSFNNTLNRNQPLRDGVENLFDGPVPSAARNVVDDLVQPQLNPGISGLLEDGSGIINPGRSTRAAEARNIVDADFISSTLADGLPKFDFNRFAQDAGGKSALLRKANAVTSLFNPRTLNTGETLADRSAELIRNTDSRIFAGNREVGQTLERLRKETEGWSNAEREAIAYVIEDGFPRNFDKSSIDLQKVTKVANEMEAMLKKVGLAEQRAGILGKLREGYFPHVVKYSSEDIEEFKRTFPDDKEFIKLVGRNQSSQFSKKRKAFQKLSQADDYIADLSERRLQFAEGTPEYDELTQKINIITNMFERNPIDAFGKRLMDNVRSMAMRDLNEQFVKDGLLVKSGESPGALSRGNRLEKLTPEQARKLGLEPGDMMHKDVLKALGKIEKIFTEDGIEKMLKHYESVQNIWKTAVTSVIPAHYLTNFVGNMFNNALAGVKIRSYKEAGRLLSGKGLTAADERLLKQAIEDGVLHQGYGADFMKLRELDPSEVTKLQKVETAVRDNAYTTFMRQNFGMAMDNFSRLSLYMHGLEKAGTRKNAADMVRKYLFNYHELTTGDKLMRMVVPFWTWTKNNLPLQFEQLAQQPRFYQTYRRLKEEMNADVEDQMPGFAKDSYMNLAPGSGYAFNPRFPSTDLDEWTDGPTGWARAFAGSTTPFLKSIYEIGANKNIFTRRPIDYDLEYKGEADPMAWVDHLVRQTGIGNKFAQFGRENSDPIADILSLFMSKPVKLDQ